MPTPLSRARHTMSVCVACAALVVPWVASAQEATEPRGAADVPAAAAPSAPPPAPPPAAVGWIAPAPAWGPPPGAAPGWGWGPRAMPEQLPYRDGEQAPPGYHLETGVRKGLVIAGASMFGAGYGISIAVAASTEGDETAMPLYVPVVGPFIVAAQVDYGGQLGGLSVMFIGVPLVIDGLVQTAGATMLIAGVAAKRKYYERDDLAERDTTPRVAVGVPAVRDPRAARDRRPNGGSPPPSAAASGLTLSGRF
jgi:hypothetical protein